MPDEEAARLSWDQTWMAVAKTMAWRGDCERGQVGAVIVDPHNRIIATGYNGPPASSPYGCAQCPRNLTDDHGPDYSACFTIHAEANALLFCDRRDREGGTIYVSSAICKSCAKMITNSGLTRVVVHVDALAGHRNPREIIHYLEEHGLKVRQMWD